MADLESDRVERTISTTDTDKFAEAICAFSNDFPNHRLPGYLLIGVDNQGRPNGLRVTDQLLQNLAGIRADGNVLPLPAMAVQKYARPQGEVAVIEVLPSDLPPIRYRGCVWIRVGPRRAIASEIEERILSERRTALAKTSDSLACAGSSLDDLTPDLFLVTYRENAIAPEIIAENRRDLREQLASLRFYDLVKDRPTYAGLLLFGQDPLRWVPGAYTQFVSFDGTQVFDAPVAEHRFAGDLLKILREIDAFIPIQIQSRPKAVSALRERMVHDYPTLALREFLMNAIMCLS